MAVVAFALVLLVPDNAPFIAVMRLLFDNVDDDDDDDTVWIAAEDSLRLPVVELDLVLDDFVVLFLPLPLLLLLLILLLLLLVACCCFARPDVDEVVDVVIVE